MNSQHIAVAIVVLADVLGFPIRGRFGSGESVASWTQVERYNTLGDMLLARVGLQDVLVRHEARVVVARCASARHEAKLTKTTISHINHPFHG
ncbi:hypothetical protein B0T26DRAFT_729940 [Lasiosphaeria miniovina]|uniref:Secreted protein n=1 Tax=Lasiosphaeria miniovina TaxID=1954250 RepID=A0AA39ZTC1_9PEZI|nr:uncharacterized protein B0T26DRAFT_729940 [Lasiosphaeria miniovina]KAK0703148.1 hypothetical protein B0T26DRAFT_729940 [Lasiosphaeria miniovina]